MCQLITGKQLTALNEIEFHESETQVIIFNNYYDSIDHTLLENPEIWDIHYQGKVYFPFRYDDTILFEKAKSEGFDTKNDRLFCCTNWNILNDENPFIQDFNSFLDLLNSDKYKKYTVILNDRERVLLEELKKCNFPRNRWNMHSSSISYLIDISDKKIESIIPDQKERYSFIYGILDGFYDNIRKLEHSGHIITATDLIKSILPQEYPINLYRGNTTALRWFERKIKTYPDDYIEIIDSNNNKTYSYQPSPFAIKRKYVICGKEEKKKEEDV